MDFEAIRGALQQAIPFRVHPGLEIVSEGEGTGVVRFPVRVGLTDAGGDLVPEMAVDRHVRQRA
jgi:hypothetical protein